MKALVSVITVTYNLIQAGRQKSVRQCINSVVEQDYPNIEHLVVDGASNDGTVDLLRQFQSRGALRYISEPDRGLYDAMNKGVQWAQGEYILFLNSDDYYAESSSIRLLAETLEQGQKRDPRLVFAFGDTYYDDYGGTPASCQPFVTHNAAPNYKALIEMPACHQSMIFRSDLLKAHPFDLQYEISADFDWLVSHVFLKGKTGAYTPYPIVVFRTGGFAYSLSYEAVAEKRCEWLSSRYSWSKKTAEKVFWALPGNASGMFWDFQKLQEWYDLHPSLVESFYRDLRTRRIDWIMDRVKKTIKYFLPYALLRLYRRLKVKHTKHG